MITKLATFRGVSSQGEPLVRVFEPRASFIKEAGPIMPQIRQWMSTYRPDDNKIAILVNALGASEYWGQNVNGDIFPEAALVHNCANHPELPHPIDDFTGKPIPPYGAWTFKQFARPYAHHKNKDPSRAFGTVEYWCWNPRMHRVELIVLLDRALAMQHGAQYVIDRIDAGEYPDVSMGCRVPYDICTICKHKSKTRHDYCKCITEFGMNLILKDGRRVGVINTYPRFFDISFVFIGADKTAKVMCKLGSGLIVPLSAVEGEWLYGVGDDFMMKAASESQFAAETFESGTHTPTRHVRTRGKLVDGQGRALVTKLEPEPEESTDILIGRTDQQLSPQSISDGVLRTNANEGEEDDPEKTAAQWKIGPPPMPNREQYPFVGTINFRGLKIGVENAPGTWRTGRGWKTLMKVPYGEFLHSKAGGTDGDKLDVYVGPDRNCKNVYIVHQNHVYGPNKGKYDEDKVMLGFSTPAQAKKTYLAHYDSDKFFRSLTTMAFPLFKRALVGGEVDGEKVASVREAMENYHADMRLEDLFSTKNASTRERTWRDKVTGGEASVRGSGVGKGLTKGAEDKGHGHIFPRSDGITMRCTGARKCSQCIRDKKIRDAGGESPYGKEKTASLHTVSPAVLKIATVLRSGWSASDLLKVSNETKAASHLKWAEIVKRIGPSKAVGRVTPLLSQTEESLPKEVLDEMGQRPDLEKSLATPSLMGMVLKPEEFQRIMLTHMGKGPLADKMDEAGAVFKPSDEEACPCSELSSEQMDPETMKSLLPSLEGKSYAGPVVRRRITRVAVASPKPEEPSTEVDSPLLSKVASAYTWYRREQMKLASALPATITAHPELHAGVYGLGLEDAFSKMATSFKPKTTLNLDGKSLAVVLGSVPLALMYSAHKRGERASGKELGLIGNLIADHPWLTTMGTATGLGALMRNPKAQQAVDEVFAAGKRIWRGKGQSKGTGSLITDTGPAI